MTNEEVERAIQFILEQQAQFAAELQKTELRMQQFREQVQEQMGKLTDAVITVTGLVGKIGEAQVRADEKIAEWAERGRETEERLNAFIVVVERYISERHNGNKEDDE